MLSLRRAPGYRRLRPSAGMDFLKDTLVLLRGGRTLNGKESKTKEDLDDTDTEQSVKASLLPTLMKRQTGVSCQYEWRTLMKGHVFVFYTYKNFGTLYDQKKKKHWCTH